MFEAFDHLEPKASNDRRRVFSTCGRYLGRMTHMGTRLIVAAGNIAHVMQAVLDPPLCCGEAAARSFSSLALTIRAYRPLHSGNGGT